MSDEYLRDFPEKTGVYYDEYPERRASVGFRKSTAVYEVEYFVKTVSCAREGKCHYCSNDASQVQPQVTLSEVWWVETIGGGTSLADKIRKMLQAFLNKPICELHVCSTKWREELIWALDEAPLLDS